MKEKYSECLKRDILTQTQKYILHTKDRKNKYKISDDNSMSILNVLKDVLVFANVENILS